MKSNRVVAFGVRVLPSAALGIVLVSWPANAGGTAPIPEPGTLSLFAAGAIAAAYLLHRKRK